MADDQQQLQAYVRRLGQCMDVAAMALVVVSYAYLVCANWADGYRWDRWAPHAIHGTTCLQILLLLFLVGRTVQKSAHGRMPFLTILPMLLLLSGLWVYPYSYDLGERRLRQEVSLETLAKACLEVASSPERLDGHVILARYPAIRRLHPSVVWMMPAYESKGTWVPGSVTIYFSRVLSYVFICDEGRRAWVLKKDSSEGGRGELLYSLSVAATQAVGTQSGS